MNPRTTSNNIEQCRVHHCSTVGKTLCSTVGKTFSNKVEHRTTDFHTSMKHHQTSSSIIFRPTIVGGCLSFVARSFNMFYRCKVTIKPKSFNITFIHLVLGLPLLRPPSSMPSIIDRFCQAFTPHGMCKIHQITLCFMMLADCGNCA